MEYINDKLREKLQPRFEKEATDIYKPFSKNLFKEYDVKRGLRNDDGTGVMAGLTSIGSVIGYEMKNGKKVPIEGHLRYRGYDLCDLVRSCENEKRFGFDEVAYLLLFGHLPDKNTLREFSSLIGILRMK